MATEAELQDRLERLNRAIDSGVQTVAYADGRQTYRDLDQMLAVRQDLERRLAELRGNAKRRRVIRLNAKKGL